MKRHADAAGNRLRRGSASCAGRVSRRRCRRPARPSVFFADEEPAIWRVEGVKAGRRERGGAGCGARACGRSITGLRRRWSAAATEADGWLARTYAAFPEQLIGRRFAVRGTHLPGRALPGRVTLTRRCGPRLRFRASTARRAAVCVRWKRVAYRRPRRILDLGTGSGILAMACGGPAAPARAGDRYRSVVGAGGGRECALNGLSRLRAWHGCGMAGRRRPGARRTVRSGVRQHPGAAALPHGARSRGASGAGRHGRSCRDCWSAQMRMVLAAHRRQGLRLDVSSRKGTGRRMVLRR